jgi:hypothetical protein
VRPGHGDRGPFVTLADGANLVWQAESVKVAFDAELWLWDARRSQSWIFVSHSAANGLSTAHRTSGSARAVSGSVT